MGGSGIPTPYYIYIDGDSGRTVQISYFGRENYSNNRHFVFTEKVQLPFFKEVDFLHGGNNDEKVFLEIVSENDSTTKAAIFDRGVLFADGCPVRHVWLDAQGKCTYCEELPKDSVLRYLKSIDYPCYLEFSKGDMQKRIQLRDWWKN
jgi:hypothetical protein